MIARAANTRLAALLNRVASFHAGAVLSNVMQIPGAILTFFPGYGFSDGSQSVCIVSRLKHHKSDDSQLAELAWHDMCLCEIGSLDVKASEIIPYFSLVVCFAKITCTCTWFIALKVSFVVFFEPPLYLGCCCLDSYILFPIHKYNSYAADRTFPPQSFPLCLFRATFSSVIIFWWIWNCL